MNKGLTFRMGQTHTHRYLEPLLSKVAEGKIDPSFVITHRATLDDGPDLYKAFRDKTDGCIKVMMRP
jgi:threonine dehydrogenase-like Zn-dependent dehydrogenase